MFNVIEKIKEISLLNGIDDINKRLALLTDADLLIKSFDLAKIGTDWKKSVQQFEMTCLFNILDLIEEIENGKYTERKTHCFILYERGKIRFIQPHHIRDRVVQRCLNTFILEPILLPTLIHNNGASIKDKGTSFARNEFEKDLRWAKRHYKDPYIVFLDISKFFDNIDHQILISKLSYYLTDDYIEFIKRYLKGYEVDVSYISDEEFQQLENYVNAYNSLDHINISDDLKIGEKILKRSLGIGSHFSQIAGVFYPSNIDHYFKTVLGVKCYGRFQDDTYIIVDGKEKAKKYENIAVEKYKELGLIINRKKTRIVSIDKEFMYLKINYFFKGEKLIKKVSHQTFLIERRRLRKYLSNIKKGKMIYEQVYNAYQGWRGMYKKYDSGYQLLKMDRYFDELFSQYKSKKRIYKKILSSDQYIHEFYPDEIGHTYRDKEILEGLKYLDSLKG